MVIAELQKCHILFQIHGVDDLEIQPELILEIHPKARMDQDFSAKTHKHYYMKHKLHTQQQILKHNTTKYTFIKHRYPINL